MEKSKVKLEKILKMGKKCKSNSEMIGKIWTKGKLKCKKVGKNMEEK